MHKIDCMTGMWHHIWSDYFIRRLNCSNIYSKAKFSLSFLKAKLEQNKMMRSTAFKGSLYIINGHYINSVIWYLSGYPVNTLYDYYFYHYYQVRALLLLQVYIIVALSLSLSLSLSLCLSPLLLPSSFFSLFIPISNQI